jgi:hypothetical protein
MLPEKYEPLKSKKSKYLLEVSALETSAGCCAHWVSWVNSGLLSCILVPSAGILSVGPRKLSKP